ncbi:MAG: hypothetical protein MJ213_05420 [Bacilli bacterium]|nr:hypothetical protein [Bacilli bacterium]
MNNKISNVRFEQINSIKKDYKEVRVTFLLDGKEGTYFIFTKSKDPIEDAKKIFYKDLKAGLVAKSIKQTAHGAHPILISACALLGVAVIALSSVLIYKAVNDNNQPALAPRYLNNPTKITDYRDDKLVGEQTITYNSDWYRTGSISKAYNPSTGELTQTEEFILKLDEKNRVTDGEITVKDGNGKITRKDIQKATFETDDKGTEYVETQYIEDGIVVELYSSYDEYENTYSVEGKKTVNSGEDKQYINGKLKEKKIRTSEGVIGNKGYDSPAKSEGKRYVYDETGKERLEADLYSETLRKYVDETHEDIMRLNVVKNYNEDGSTEETVNLLLGSAESNKKGASVYEKIYYYSDKEAKQLTRGRINEAKYDDFNRPTSSIVYELDIESTEKEKWDLSKTVNNLYHANENQAYFTTNVSFDESSVASVIFREFDKYGRITYQEAISGTTRKSIKTSTKYEYGDPVPVKPSRDNLY